MSTDQCPSRAFPPAVVAIVLAAALVVAAGGVPSAGASSSSVAPKATTTTVPAPTTTGPGAPAPSTTVAGQRPAAEQQVSVLAASRDDVRARVAGIDARIRDQNTKLEASEAAFRDSMQRGAAAHDAATAARATADAARSQVRDYAVEAFIRPPAQDALSVLAIAQVQEAGYASDVLQIVADQRRQVVDVYAAASDKADRDAAAAEAAAADARAKADAAQAQVRSLESARADQARLASDLDGRLDAALSEASALKAIDAKASKALADQEIALRASVAVPAATPTVAAAQVTAAPTGTPATVTTRTRPPTGTPTPTARPPTPTAPPTTRPPVVQPPATPPPGIVGFADMTKVGGIWVNKRIAGQVRALLTAATTAGFSLSGGGFRDPAGQIALRQAHCGTSTYAIYQMPASQCTPPTARPGTSMHEQGLAIDFMSSGRLISSRSEPAFLWLAANASRFGLFNLPSEPWHWSVNGN